MDFTKAVKRAVDVAHAKALSRSLGHVDTEQIRLGVTSIRDGAAVRILNDFGVPFHVDDPISEPTPEAGGSHLPFTVKAKKVFDIAFAEASGLRDVEINTGHVLLALVIVGDYSTTGLDPDRVRRVLLQRAYVDPAQ